MAGSVRETEKAEIERVRGKIEIKIKSDRQTEIKSDGEKDRDSISEWGVKERERGRV